MAAKPQPAEATVYLQIRLEQTFPYSPSRAKVVKSTQRKPEFVESGCIVTKIKVRIPAEAWNPFEPEAVIDVPADLIQHPIAVEAEEADQ